jgi:hypothetical protein
MGKFLRLAAVAYCLGLLALGVVCFDPACLSPSPPPGLFREPFAGGGGRT